MGDYGNCPSVIVRKRLRSHERDFGAIRLCNIGNLYVIRRHDDALETTAKLRRLDRPSNDRLSMKKTNILSRNAFAATPCGDYGDVHVSIALRSATTT